MKNRNNFILFVNTYAEPNPVGSNNTPVASAIALKELGYDVAILTITSDPTWKGPIPDDSSPLLAGLPHIRVIRQGIKFIIVKVPPIWSDRYQTIDEWNESVNWAKNALIELNPSLVHQWVWQFVSYILTAAVRLNFPTVYSAQDYGLLCQRTFLLTGNEQVCDGIIGKEKCSQCVLDGRNYLGKINEFIVKLPLAGYLINKIYKMNCATRLRKLNIVRTPVLSRTTFKIQQANEIAQGVDAIQVSSKLGSDLFNQFGASNNKIFTVPWFHDHVQLCDRLPEKKQKFTVAYVGRIAPYKGLEVLLDSLSHLDANKSIVLKIAGEIDSNYGIRLKKKYGENIGNHKIEWVGWLDKEDAYKFYGEVHVVIVPSIMTETGPRSLIEALAHRRPVICTDLPSMNTLIKDGVNGLLFKPSDHIALAGCISKLSENPKLLESYSKNCINAPTVKDFIKEISLIYIHILNKKKDFYV